MSNVREEVVDIIVEQLGVDRDQISDSKKIVEDLKADSLDVTEFIMTLEEKYDCEISEEDAEKLMTVGDVVAYINSNKN